MKDRIRRAFDKAGATYNAAAAAQRLVAAECAALCPAGPVGRVLEIGAGSGLLTRLLLPKLSPRLYVALDLAPGMLAAPAMAKLPGIARLAADGEAAPFRPGSFDVLASASAMHWYADPGRSIPTNLRLLAPGGRFCLAVFVEGTLAELAATSAATGFGSVYPLRPTRFYRELLASLPGVAFTAEERRHTIVYRSPRELLWGLKQTGATHTPVKRPTGAKRYREFLRLYRERYAAEGGVTASYVVLYLAGQVG